MNFNEYNKIIADKFFGGKVLPYTQVIACAIVILVLAVIL